LSQTHTDINNYNIHLNNGNNQKCHAAVHAGFQDSIELPACTAA